MLTVCAIAALAATFVASPAARAADDVDMLLVLGADASYSMVAPKFELQRQGYAKAIVNPRVINAITSGVSSRIAVCYFEWSGVVWQDLIIDWTVIGSLEAAQRFSEKILLAPRSYPERTSISAAIHFASEQFARAPWVSHRRVIDISGDGDNNAGRGVTTARDEAVAKGITINGLAILSNDLRDHHINPRGGLEQYYRRNVIGGPGAFVVVSVGFESLAMYWSRNWRPKLQPQGTRVTLELVTPYSGTAIQIWVAARRALSSHRSLVDLTAHRLHTRRDPRSGHLFGRELAPWAHRDHGLDRLRSKLVIGHGAEGKRPGGALTTGLAQPASSKVSRRRRAYFACRSRKSRPPGFAR